MSLQNHKYMKTSIILFVILLSVITPAAGTGHGVQGSWVGLGCR